MSDVSARKYLSTLGENDYSPTPSTLKVEKLAKFYYAHWLRSQYGVRAQQLVEGVPSTSDSKYFVKAPIIEVPDKDVAVVDASAGSTGTLIRNDRYVESDVISSPGDIFNEWSQTGVTSFSGGTSDSERWYRFLTAAFSIALMKDKYSAVATEGMKKGLGFSLSMLVGNYEKVEERTLLTFHEPWRLIDNRSFLYMMENVRDSGGVSLLSYAKDIEKKLMTTKDYEPLGAVWDLRSAIIDWIIRNRVAIIDSLSPSPQNRSYWLPSALIGWLNHCVLNFYHFGDISLVGFPVFYTYNSHWEPNIEEIVAIYGMKTVGKPLLSIISRVAYAQSRLPSENIKKATRAGRIAIAAAGFLFTQLAYYEEYLEKIKSDNRAFLSGLRPKGVYGNKEYYGPVIPIKGPVLFETVADIPTFASYVKDYAPVASAAAWYLNNWFQSAYEPEKYSSDKEDLEIINHIFHHTNRNTWRLFLRAANSYAREFPLPIEYFSPYPEMDEEANMYKYYKPAKYRRYVERTRTVLEGGTEYIVRSRPDPVHFYDDEWIDSFRLASQSIVEISKIPVYSRVNIEAIISTVRAGIAAVTTFFESKVNLFGALTASAIGALFGDGVKMEEEYYTYSTTVFGQTFYWVGPRKISVRFLGMEIYTDDRSFDPRKDIALPIIIFNTPNHTSSTPYYYYASRSEIAGYSTLKELREDSVSEIKEFLTGIPVYKLIDEPVS